MTQKNLEKAERKARRYPPIPYTRRGKTKKDILSKAITKHKGKTDTYSYVF